MSDHYLSQTPKQFIDRLIASGQLSNTVENKSLRITIFIVTVDGRVLALKREGQSTWFLPSKAYPPPDGQSTLSGGGQPAAAQHNQPAQSTSRQAQQNQLFKFKLQLVDEKPVPEECLAALELTIPATITTWLQLKQYIAQNAHSTEVRQKVIAMQRKWWQENDESLSVELQSRLQQHSRSRTPVQQPSLLPSIEEVQMFRQRIPQAAQMSDEEIRRAIHKRKVDQLRERHERVQREYRETTILKLALDLLEAPLKMNGFKDSLQILDFARDEPVRDGNEVIVIATVSHIPENIHQGWDGADGHEALSLSVMETEGITFRLKAEFFARVAKGVRMYCKQMPYLDNEQRRALLLNQLSVVLATKGIAGELKEEHDVLILRHMQGEDAVLLLMQIPQEDCKLYANHEVIAYSHDASWASRVGRVSMEDTSSEGGHAWRRLHMTNDWLAESVFANDGRLMATWVGGTDRSLRSQGQRKEMVESKLINWLA